MILSTSIVFYSMFILYDVIIDYMAAGVDLPADANMFENKRKLFWIGGFKLQNSDFDMKGINCRNVEKFVLNHNREVSKLKEQVPTVALELESILGTNSDSIRGSLMFALSSEEMLYYSSEYFIVLNLISKESVVIKREGCFNHTVLYINRFKYDSKTDIVFTIERGNNQLYVGQLAISGNITQANRTFEETKERGYSWRVSRLTGKFNYSIEDISFHAERSYLYLLTSLSVQDKIQKYLWVYDLRRECMIMSPLIKPSVTKMQLNRVRVTEQSSAVYLLGKNYFRLWTISFTEKTMKESNYRNIERALFNKQIVKVFDCHVQGSVVMGVLTESNLVLVRKNELLSSQSPPERSMKERKNKENIEMELQNSLNQIYRMKFLFDDEDNERPSNHQFQVVAEQLSEDEHFCCASEVWSGQGGESIVVATRSGNLLTYVLNNGQMKLVNTLLSKVNYSFDYMTVSRRGQVIILSQNNCQNMYIINKYLLNSEEKEEEVKLFWGMGQINKENILAIGSPAVHERICTLGENNVLKLWSFKGRERKILFEEKLASKANEIAVHPCGLLVAINFTTEIKLMSLLPSGIYEVMSAKTNYNSKGLRFSDCGNYLVSNQENLLIFYNPFTLTTLGYIEPPELKSKVLLFQISGDGNYIVYHTSDYSLYIHPLELFACNKFETILPVHGQIEPYKCFYFDNNVMKNISSKNGEVETIFIGCTEHKYMTVYKNYGKELVVEYPVEDCYIISLCVADGWLFAATSKGSIRVYKWPIRESECEMEILSVQQKAVRLRHPPFEQFTFWSDNKKITKMHKLGFANKLLVSRQGGILTILNYSKFQADKFEQVGQRKKMTQIVNDSFFITKNESDKRNRLIEKTQGDILKIESQIAKEKSILERKYEEECVQVERNFEQKIDLQMHEKKEYLTKIKEQNEELHSQIEEKRCSFQKKKNSTLQFYSRKKQYEQERNQIMQKAIEDLIAEHKSKLTAKIDSHKKDIGDLKNMYRGKVNTMKQQFEGMVERKYPSLVSLKNVEKQVNSTLISKSRKCSLKVQPSKIISSDFQCEINNEEILQLGQKVEEIHRSNDQLQKQLQQLKKRVKTAEYDDEGLQKEFQRCLEQYNSHRFNNLSMHSQVLKMRTQLLQRKEIMDNKQEIINVAFQEREKLENYKELVKGSLTKLHERKEKMQDTITEKQSEVSAIFAELAATLNQYERMKREDSRLSELLNVYEKDKKEEQIRIQKAVNRLKELKRHLLLQGLTEDVQQKELFVEQQNLLTSINFYKKRMNMEALKQKKNKLLKKSALNLVLKQNKNLLEECNQLREETIGFEHQITDLGQKLGEANKMISIECKLKGQKSEVLQQRNQLQAIRALFTNQLNSYNQGEEELKQYELNDIE